MMMTCVQRSSVPVFARRTDAWRSWRDPSVPLSDEEAFETIKAGIDAMPAGVKMMLNSGTYLSESVLPRVPPRH